MPEQFPQTTDYDANVLAYDLVTSPSGEMGTRQPTDREKQLFSVIEMPIEAAGVRPKPRHVTPESEDEARETVKLAGSQDIVLRHLLDDYLQAKGVDTVDLPRVLRTDSELRLSVGVHLIDKISRLSPELPQRIRDNTEKNPSEGGYDGMGYLMSQEYTALLALSMLDGSFSSRREGSDTVTYDSAKDDGLGQHRYAARQVLRSS